MSQKRQKQPLFLHSNSFLSSYRLAILGMSLKIILLKWFIVRENNWYEQKYPGMSQASFGAHPLVMKYLPFTISTFSWCLQAFLSLTKHKTKRTKQSFVDSFIAPRRLNANFETQISCVQKFNIPRTPRPLVEHSFSRFFRFIKGSPNICIVYVIVVDVLIDCSLLSYVMLTSFMFLNWIESCFRYYAIC